MSISAKLKNAHISSQKMRLIVNSIRGNSLKNAIYILELNNKKGAFIIKKLLNSVISNAKNNKGLNINKFFIYKIFVDNASTYKRIKAKAKGKANLILKRNCNITVIIK